MKLRRSSLLCIAVAILLVAGGRGVRADELAPPREIARRAVEAARDGRVGEVADLRRWLIASASRTEDEFEVARLVILDSLIAMKSAEGAETLVPCLASSPLVRRAAVVLAVQHGDGPALLAAFDALDRVRYCNAEWLAVGNTLAARRTPGFASRLLGGLGVELRVLADDRAIPNARWKDPTGSVAADFYQPIPAGFPPVAVYMLSAYPMHGTSLLADGPHPIRYTRSLETTEIGYGGSGSTVWSPDARLEWMAGLLGVVIADLGIERLTVRSYGPLHDRAFLAAVGDARGGVVRRVEALADRLLKGGFVSKEERAALHPRVMVSIIDRRTDTKVPLPELPAEWTEEAPPK